ncbi:MAG TPA: M23 family metallopeptidase [Streptosporangiales bacterium]
MNGTSVLRVPYRCLLVLAGWLGLLVLPSGAAAAPAAPTSWQLPLPDTVVLRAFDPPASRWSAGHRGVDLAAAVGTDVLAAGDGVVAFAGQVGGRQVVVVRHGELRTTYLPVRAGVRVGAHVRAGQPIGTLLAGTHCGTRPCLHWGLLRGDTYLDPMSLLRPGHARLVRVWSGTPRPGRPDRDPSARPAGAATLPGRPRESPSPAAVDGDRGGHRAAAWSAAAATAAAGAAAGVAVIRRRRVRRAPP